MRWAVAFHPDQIATTADGRLKCLNDPMHIAESCLPAAIGQGWIVLGRDSEVLSEPLPKMDMTLLSNPRRSLDDEGAR